MSLWSIHYKIWYNNSDNVRVAFTLINVSDFLVKLSNKLLNQYINTDGWDVLIMESHVIFDHKIKNPQHEHN